MDTLTHAWRSSRGCCLVSALVALVVILGSCAALGFGVARWTEAAAGDGLDVMLVVDQSGSLWELGGVGTDPAMARMEAARLFASTLGVDGPLADYRLGVIYFGTSPTLVAPLTSLTHPTGGRAAVLEALSATPQPMGWTDVNAALALAYRSLFDGPDARTNHAKAIVLFTDGRPQTADATTPAADDDSLAALRGWVQRFADQQAAFFTVLLGNPITDADVQMDAVYRPFWTDAAQQGVTLRFYDVQAGEDLLDVYHDVMVQLHESQSQGAIRRQNVQDAALMPLRVPEGWAQATFVARKSNAELALTLLRPDGTQVRPGDVDLSQLDTSFERVDVWSIKAPQAGQWQISAAGEGVVTVWLDYRAAPPAPTPTTAQPMPATATPTAQATLAPTPTPRPTPALTAAAIAQVDSGRSTPVSGTRGNPPAWPFFAGAAVATVGGLSLAVRRRRQPILDGKLRVTLAPEGARIGQTWDLGQSRRASITLGRSADCDIALPDDPALLPKAAMIRAERDTEGQIVPWLIDLSGTGLVQVKGKAPSTRRALADGDVIALGAYLVRYENVSLRRESQQWRPPVRRPTDSTSRPDALGDSAWPGHAAEGHPTGDGTPTAPDTLGSNN